MVLILLWLASSASAFPLSPAEDNAIFDYQCSDILYCRTIFGIVWSCLATIFACTWVAVHPNVPSPESAYPFQPVVHRVAITICALLVPEYIVAWSIRQWLVASHIIKEVKQWEKEAKDKPVIGRDVRRDSGLGMSSPISPGSAYEKRFSLVTNPLQNTFMPSRNEGKLNTPFELQFSDTLFQGGQLPTAFS